MAKKYCKERLNVMENIRIVEGQTVPSDRDDDDANREKQMINLIIHKKLIWHHKQRIPD